MRYVTTRSDLTEYSPRDTLGRDRASDGGFFIPREHPCFSREEILELKKLSFSQCVAKVLNCLFDTKITSWDVEFCTGRYPVRITKLPNKVTVSECWHNLGWRFSRMIENLYTLLDIDKHSSVSEWAEIGIRIAVLFGIFGELMRQGIKEPVDIAVVSGDFAAAVSAWYGKHWGLPIGNIICACNENSAVWDLFCHGQLRTDGTSVETFLPDADVLLPDRMERMIFGCLGGVKTEDYLKSCRTGNSFYLDEEDLQKMRTDLYVTVSSSPRILSTIPNVYYTCKYLLSPYSALIYSGVMDYRSKTGSGRNVLIIGEKSPVCDLETVAQALDMDPEELKKHFNF